MTDTLRSHLPRFGRLPRELVRNPQMPDRAVRLFGLLDDYANADGTAFPSRSTLAADLGCSVDSVDRAITALVEAGWLLKQTRRRDDRSFMSTLYTLTLGPGDSRTVAAGGSRTDAARGSRTGAEGVAARVPTEGEPQEGEPDRRVNVTASGDGETLPLDVEAHHVKGQTCENDPMTSTPSRAKQPVSDADPDWSRFWSLYPRKTGKGAARAAWGRALGKTTAAEILAAVERFAGTVRELRYCPHPTTWLNQERWTDALPDAAGSAYGRSGPSRGMSAAEWIEESKRG